VKPPSPSTQLLVGHLGRWGLNPLQLLDEGASLGPVFTLRLWRSAIVGYSPAWNRFVLGDLELFRSKRSLSGLSPHLGAGVVQTDAPSHRARRRELNPSFARAPLSPLAQPITDVVRVRLPIGAFDAVQWSAALIREVLNLVFFGGLFPAALLDRFLRPLDAPLPIPFLRRPWLFAKVNRALTRAIEDGGDTDLSVAFRGMRDGTDEARVALSAGYDTTAHTLAWLLYHVAGNSQWLEGPMRRSVIDEALRLYPAGWVGTRRCAEDTEFEGVAIRRGTLVMYSPYLTHRDPMLWVNPLDFTPERFAQPVPAWGFIPFSAGERTCLGKPLARLILECVLAAFQGSQLQNVTGDPRPRAGITLAPSEPLWLVRR
jgi:cytochrome P450